MSKATQPAVAFTGDFETYYADDYSLSKKSMTTVQYIRDHRFEVHMFNWMCPQLDVHQPRHAGGRQGVVAIVDRMKAIQNMGIPVMFVGHNLAFDALILKEHFNFEPDLFFDTSLLCNLVLGNELKNNKLETLAKKLDLEVDPERSARVAELLGVEQDPTGKKLKAALNAVKGKRWDEIKRLPKLCEAYSIYCDVDVLLTHQAYEYIRRRVTTYDIMIQTYYLRAFIRMPVDLDVALLSDLKDDYVETRTAEVEAFFATLTADNSPSAEGLRKEATAKGFNWLQLIRSKDKYASLLRTIGVPESSIPMKPGKNGPIYAFAKNDMALEILPDVYPELDLLPEAVRLRMEYNTSAVESKLARFRDVGATGSWGFHVKPFGAKNTARHSGSNGSGASPQNLSRSKPTIDTACGYSLRVREHLSVRDAIMAKEGQALAVADLSGIELRTAMWLANDTTAMEVLSDPRRDLYVEDGREYFSKPDMTKADKNLRQAAKVVDLSCLAHGTEVLTTNGWIPIQTVDANTMVWDGVEWVHCAGAVYMGFKSVISLGGIYITADHEVLDYDGWHRADEAEAFSVERYARWNLPDTEPRPPVQKVNVKPPVRVAHVYDLLNCGERQRFTVRSPETKFTAVVHNCQYLVGWRKILHQAKLWKIPMDADMAQLLHAGYRRRHPAVIEMWGVMQQYMRDLTQGHKFERDMYPLVLTHEGIILPNNFRIRYPGIQYHWRERRYTYWNASKNSRVGLHAGLVVENCLAGDTEVLTEHRGWVRIVDVTEADRVWNGTRWCKHGGLAERGKRTTIDVKGVRMTLDHKVLTASGWCEAWKVGDLGVDYAKGKIFKS